MQSVFHKSVRIYFTKKTTGKNLSFFLAHPTYFVRKESNCLAYYVWFLNTALTQSQFTKNSPRGVSDKEGVM